MPVFRARLIDLGRIVAEQTVEETKEVAVFDQYDGMDPLTQARKGGPVRWVELVEVSETA